MDFNKNTNKLSIAIILIALSFYIGHQFGTNQDVLTSEAITSESMNGTEFSLFWETLDLVKDKHLKADEIEDDEILYGAIKGAVSAFDDPYSSFFPPEDAEKFEEDVSGVFGGIGAEIGIREDILTIVSPLKSTPAERAGLKSGDKILKVDDTFTDGMSIDEAVKAIRGPEGEEVVLLISREDWGEARDISLIREVIEVPTLDWEMKDNKIAYIQLYSFNANAPQLFYNASLSALISGSKGLVIDLRNNSGGYLDVAINLAGWFMDRGEIVVKEKFRDGSEREFRSNGNGAWSNVPIVILVNGGSASASEILAGAIRDELGAILVGEKTFGKGTVQEIKNLKDGSKVKITVAEWILPSGEKINEEGLEPNVRVDFTEENLENDEDPQLDRAMEIIRGLIKNSQ
ncbi:MAG: S41 family peptidase [Candidatus Paceibacterota bacterium]